MTTPEKKKQPEVTPSWLRQIVGAFETVQSLLPEPNWLQGDLPHWVIRVGAEVVKSLIFTGKLKEGAIWTPGEVGAMIGHQFGYWNLSVEFVVVVRTFRKHITRDRNGIALLESIVIQMWADGWAPREGNINLFTSHFGALLADALLVAPDAVPVFRSIEAIDHFSIYLPPRCLEVFPFHKIHKALLDEKGESLLQLYDEVFSISPPHGKSNPKK